MAAKPKASTAVAKAKVQVPVSADLMAAIQADIQEQALMVTPSPSNRIKLNSESGKKFVFPDKSEVTEFLGVIVDFSTVQILRQNQKYVKDADNPIVCYASATKPSDLAPLPDVLTPQAVDCKSCSKSKFSADGEKPECNLRKHLAILPVDADAESDMLVLDAPFTSAKAFDKYAQSTLVGSGVPVWAVVTKFTFDQNTKFDSPRYEFVERLDGEQAALVYARRQEARSAVLAAPTFTEVGDEPKPKGKLQAPKKR